MRINFRLEDWSLLFVSQANSAACVFPEIDSLSIGINKDHPSMGQKYIDGLYLWVSLLFTRSHKLCLSVPSPGICLLKVWVFKRCSQPLCVVLILSSDDKISELVSSKYLVRRNKYSLWYRALYSTWKKWQLKLSSCQIKDLHWVQVTSSKGMC